MKIQSNIILKAISKLKTTNVRPDYLCTTYCWVYKPQVIDCADLLLIPNCCEYFLHFYSEKTMFFTKFMRLYNFNVNRHPNRCIVPDVW